MAASRKLPVNINELTGDRAYALRGPLPDQERRQPASGQWSRGQSGNPNGRPAGSRNLTYRQLHELMTAQGEAVVAAVLAAALRGDSTAQKLVMDRILPRRVCNPIRDITLPPLRTAADAALALGDITTAVLDGRITADEAANLASIIEVFIKVAATHDLERRICELETRPVAHQ